MAEMAAEMMKLDADKIEIVSGIEEEGQQVLSDKDLEVLLDRRKEVFRDRGKEWNGRGEEVVANGDGDVEMEGVVEPERKARFGVYVGREEDGDDTLAGLMGE